jgi:rare lipoprotein A
MKRIILTLIILFSILNQAQAEVYLTASWYSRASLIKEGTWKNGQERRMANGESFNENNLTCANRLFPLGSMLRVTNLKSGKAVIVKTTDRIGKRFAKTRIDLSAGAFDRIDNRQQGIVQVKVELLKGGDF